MAYGAAALVVTAGLAFWLAFGTANRVGGGAGPGTYSPVLERAWSASHVDEIGWTDLHYAAVLNRPDLARRLLDAGASIDAPLRVGGNTGQLVETLRAFDAPATVIRRLVNEVEGFTATPLLLSVSAGAGDVAELLLDRGANVEAANEIGSAPLHEAAAAGDFEIVELLLDRGANVEAADDLGETPLHAAVLSSSVEVVELLLDRGANVEATTDSGQTPFDVAGNDAVRSVLAAAGVGGCSRSMGLLEKRTYTRRDTLDGSCSTEHYPAGKYALYYGFTLDEAAKVTMKMTSPDVDSWLALRRGSSPGSVGPLAADDDDGTELDARIVRSLDPGSYTIEATTLAPGETGDFTLTVTVRARTPPFLPEPADVANGVSTGGGVCSRSMGLLERRTYTRRDALDGSCSTEHYPAGEYALYYGFTLDEAATVTMEMTSQDVNSWLALRRGSSPGSVGPLAEEDDGGTGRGARIERSLAPGSYTIEATTLAPGETGDFTLAVTVSAVSGGCSRSMGLLERRTYTRRDALDGSCSTEHYPAGEYALYYGFTLDEAATVTLEMTSVDVDSWLALRSGSPPGGVEPLEDDNDGGTGLDARIEWFLNAGDYTIEATTLDAGETGDFTLTVTVGETGGVPYKRELLVAGAFSAAIESVGDEDTYRITVSSSGRLTVHTTGVTDTFGELLDASGNVLVSDDDGGTDTNFRLTRPVSLGTYYVRVRHFADDGTGDYAVIARLAAQ